MENVIEKSVEGKLNLQLWLLRAIKSNDIGLVKELLEEGAEVNPNRLFGQIPLSAAVDVAIFEDKPEVYNYLIYKGADVNNLTHVERAMIREYIFEKFSESCVNDSFCYTAQSFA